MKRPRQLTPKQRAIMAALADNEGMMTARTLANKIEPADITPEAAVDRIRAAMRALIERGFVTRPNVDLWRLTTAGHAELIRRADYGDLYRRLVAEHARTRLSIFNEAAAAVMTLIELQKEPK